MEGQGRLAAGAAGDGGAGGEAAEAGDGVAVPLGIEQELSTVLQPGHEAHAVLLVLQVIAVLQRQIEEQALADGQRAVETLREGVARNGARVRVAGESAGRAAEDVARHLVEQQAERDAAARLTLAAFVLRLEERRVGNEWVISCKCRWA